jgi:superfamily II DNA or RNA helicase/HKD family nuclease
LVPRRHVATWWEATPEERRELVEGLEVARDHITRSHRPDGFNVGMNLGAAAGQTVFHLHQHVIPRYDGDVRDPRGGVRHVIPAKANYLASPAGGLLLNEPHARPLVRGGDDPFLPHLLAGLDRAVSADLVAAFVLESGVLAVIEHLRDLLARSGRLRLVTGDYLGLTEPEALAHLLDLEGDRHLRVREAGATSFHPKAYLLHHPDGSGTGYVGSSNLSATALGAGVEWNYRVVSSADRPGFGELCSAFEALFHHPACRPVTTDWIEAYRQRRPALQPAPGLPLPLAPEPVDVPSPHAVQREALAALEATRQAGNAAALVVLATGLGKTWLAAFDSNRDEYQRVLFVAHRDEILGQALETFRRVRPGANLGRYTGTEKAPEADVLFASVQTLGRLPHLRNFAPDAFDYVVVDEFHHAAAATYRRLIGHFKPKFLLGLTATPERSDGGDLLALCGENLAYRCDLADGIRRGLLNPFRYFGVPDDIDYRNIPWRSTRFDEEALTAAVATRDRAENILEQHRKHAGKRTLAFCCSTRHADFMADFFNQNGLRAAAVHSGPGSAPRAASLEQLGEGQLDVVCAVDMFNEGVDLPLVDTVMMLRPTESRVVWLQQLGRGLRKAAGKDALTVIDYIGNHRSFLLKVRALLEGLMAVGPADADVARALEQVSAARVTLPPGCSVTYELVALDVLQALLRRGGRAQELEAYYRGFEELHGARPRATEAYHAGYDPGAARGHDGSWLRFVERMGGLLAGQVRALGAANAFLAALETTQMTRSFKMLTLKALLNLGQLPGSVGVEALAAEFAGLARRSAALRADVGEDLDDPARLAGYLERNPLAAWAGARGTGGTAYFSYEGGTFRSTFVVPPELVPDFRELVEELVEWRLAAYLGRRGGREGGAGPERAGAPTLWGHYPRQDIPPLFGLEYSEAVWNVGYVRRGDQLFLLVTLEKGGLAESFQYQDRFLGPDLFQWQSQNRTRRDSAEGRAISGHRELGYRVHLFVRRAKKIKGKQAPFVYCGEVRFVDWEGDGPVTVRWRLAEAVPQPLRATLQVHDQTGGS